MLAALSLQARHFAKKTEKRNVFKTGLFADSKDKFNPF